MNKLKKELLTQKKLKELQVNLAKEFGLDQVIKRDNEINIVLLTKNEEE